MKDKKSINFLPIYFQSEKNEKFLANTIDQFIKNPELERIDGYVGSKLIKNYNPIDDSYISELTPIRKTNNLVPAGVFKNEKGEIKKVVTFDDLIGRLIEEEASSNDDADSLIQRERLFRPVVYVYNPKISWDMLVNYDQYYWLVDGPDAVVVTTSTNIYSQIVGTKNYTMPNGYAFSNGMKVVFNRELTSGTNVIFSNTEYIVEGVGTSISLIRWDSLVPSQGLCTIINETFDNTVFDNIPFDSDKAIPIIHDYITINRSSKDLNPWSRYNRWFHADIIRIVSEINGTELFYDFNNRAKRPIIEFKPNIKLFNFGINGKDNIDLFDNSTEFPFQTIVGSFGYYIDGVLLSEGSRVIFNNSYDKFIRNKIYRVNLTTATGQINLFEDISSKAENLDSIAINLGNFYGGKSIYYDSIIQSWKLSQQHDKHNQPPLFDVVDENFNSYSNVEIKSNFLGTKIFGYKLSTGDPDQILGFSVAKNNNFTGIGSFQFQNFFDIEKFTVIENQVVKTINVGTTYLRINDKIENVWVNNLNVIAVPQTPIIQEILVTENTNTLEMTSLYPIISEFAVGERNAIVNGIPATTTSTIVNNRLKFFFENTLTQNTYVGLKYRGFQPLTSNDAYYDTPLGILSNPLNDVVSDLTLSQLTDNVASMIEFRRLGNFKGEFPGNSNLRDLGDFELQSQKIVHHENPLAFAYIFLGNTDHNVIESLRFVSSQYSQFKSKFLNVISKLNFNNNAIELCDLAMIELNQNYSTNDLFYKSDMIGFGNDKTIRQIKVTSSDNLEYPLGESFSLEFLSFKSVLVYKNKNQLLHNRDYVFFIENETIKFLTPLSINDILEFHIFPSTLGSFIPPTPTKLGFYPAYKPQILLDDRYSGQPVKMIQGHDGSLIKAFNDYRDDIILELEKRIYNNIKVYYDWLEAAINGADNAKYYTTRFRKSGDPALVLTEYTYIPTDLLAREFYKWLYKNNLDLKNNSYDENDWKTWNFKNSQLSFNYTDWARPIPSGTYRFFYTYYLNTDRPHTHPWEILGFSIKPLWWEKFYGAPPYSSLNTELWTDINFGIIREGEYEGTRYLLARGGIVDNPPVDEFGNLRNPQEFLIGFNSVFDKKKDWIFGDYSPVEVAWRNSSEFPFSNTIAIILSRPGSIIGPYFDTSRRVTNPLFQLLYSEDNLYLDPRKMLIEGYNTEQTAGLINIIIEYGKYKDPNYLENLANDLKYFSMNLFHPLGGFTSKDKLRIKINAVDPDSTSPGLSLPPEDYELIVHTGSPVKKARISGIIVQVKDGKYLLKGYDNTYPWFTILKPIVTNNSPTLIIGGKEESYTIWQPYYGDGNAGLNSINFSNTNSSAKFYKKGQIVFYNQSYYRVIISHSAGKFFDQSFFSKLPTVPTVGGVKVLIPEVFESVTSRIEYGTEFSSVQEIVNVILGYGKWLEKRGFVFDEYNNELGETLNWLYAAKEFLFWSTHNWSEGNIITLSPFAEKLKFSYPYGVVGNITPQTKYIIKKADGQLLPIENLNVLRTGNDTILTTKNTEDGIFFAVLDVVQKEHGIVLNNTTIFNDTIYDPASGYKQERLRLIGFRTKNWNGDITSPGFILDDVKIIDWEPYRRYYPSQVVQFNGQYYSAKFSIINDKIFDFTKYTLLDKKPVKKLISNFDYKINQFDDFYSLDIDNFDINQQRLAKQLIGFNSRNYLDKLIPDETAQYKFYQGFIREKGTKKPIDKIIKYNKNVLTGIEIKEEWAFRIGAYGGESTLKEIEVLLEEAVDTENPYIIKIVDSNQSSDVIHYISNKEILITPKDFNINSIFLTEDGTYKTNLFKLLNAGYVRIEDVDATAYNKNSVLDIANNSLLTNGNTIWLGFLENGEWDVYRYSLTQAKIKGVFVSSPGAEITFVTDLNHGLKIGNIISVIRFSPQVDGVYIVTGIPKSNQFSVKSQIVSITNEVLEYYGSLFSFQSVRFSNFEDLSNNKEFLFYDYGSKVWVDEDTNKKWQVLEKTKNYETSIEYGFGNLPPYQKIGFDIFASDYTKTIVISAPTYYPRRYFEVQYGKVNIGALNKNNDIQFYFDFKLNSLNGIDNVYCQPNTSTEFGYSLAYDIGKDLFFVGAPAASKIRAVSSASIMVPLVVSTITARTATGEGVVKVSSRNSTNNGEQTKFVLAQPFQNTLTNARFGHSLYINQVDKNSSTTLLVGAPGLNSGTVYAYTIDQNCNINAFNTSGIGQVSLITAPVSTSSFVYVNFSSPNIAGGTTATGVAIKSPGGLTVTNIIVTNRGSGYTSPPTITFTGSNMSVIGQATATIGLIKVEGTYSIVLSNGVNWGHKIVGSLSGSDIAISAPDYLFNNGYSGIIQIFDKNLYWKQTIISPLKKYEVFGHTMEISPSGKFLFVSSVNATTSFNTFGKVVVYKKNDNDEYAILQILENPVQDTDLKFGESISINGDEKVLAITSLGTNRSEVVKFFQNRTRLIGETTFDNKETRFITSVPDAGTAYIFNNFDDKFIQAEELIPKDMFVGGQFGKKVVSTSKNIFVGAPFNNDTPTEVDKSRFYQFKVKNENSLTWKSLRNQDALVDIESIRKLSLIDLQKDELIDYLDLFDPLKGKIPGVAEQELKYKSIVDPAVYSIALTGLTIDTENNWLDKEVGCLWWDLSNAKYIWYEQGDEVFKKNNWGKLFPGASIDVYEWVKSSYLPSEWANLADTNQGLAKGISGQPKYPDNSVLSVKQVLNSVTGSFENVYYFWVKNKSIVPNIKNRKMPASQVAQYISDPLSMGMKYVEFLSHNSFALANCQGIISGNNTSFNIQYDNFKNSNPLHTEWMLLSEGDSNSMPNDLLNKKLIDSLLGRDSLGNMVPEKGLNSRNSYGLSIRPRQTLFKNRFAAIRSIIDFTNDLLAVTPITGTYNFDNLNKVEEIPNNETGEYDFVVDDLDQLQEINTDFFKQAKLTCNVINGRIVSVTIVSQGYGYKSPPKVEIIYSGVHTGVLKTSINSVGQVTNVIIENSGGQYEFSPELKVRSHASLILIDTNAGNRWTLYHFNYTFFNWYKIRTQLYNTPLYWEYIDYKANEFKEFKAFNFIIENSFELNKLTNVSVGDYIKINNVGDGRFVVLEKVNGNGNFDLDYNLIFSERGTIRLKSTLWNVTDGQYAYDILTLDETLYDQIPDAELTNIIYALKNDIFVNELKVNWNLLFFNAVKFAMTEQKNLDWVFKTSFINVKAVIAELDQASAYRVDNSEYIEDFIKEIKPYHTKIRNFTAGYETLDVVDLNVTDFDLPAFYNEANERFETPELKIENNQLSGVNIYQKILNNYPYTNYIANYSYYVKEVVIGDGGEGYTQQPIVVFQAANTGPGFKLPEAKAYIRNGKVYRVVITDPGANLIGNVIGPVKVDFTGGGLVTRTARASVILENQNIRKNIISLRFDRNSRIGELGDKVVTFTTTTDGSSIAYELPFMADSDKNKIIPTLAKKLILSKNYNIVDFSDGTIIGTNKSKFVFNNIAPAAGQELKIIFQKSIKVFNAIDRIENYYEPTYSMPGKQINLLMYGMEYPANLIQALPFNHSMPLLGTETISTSIFDNGGGFDNFVDFYARNKLINSLERSTTTLVLSSVAGIVPGQVLNFLHVSTVTSGQVFRTDTIVQSIITAQNKVIISSPVYTIRSAVSTNTTIGSLVRIETINPFFGSIRKNDTIEISGITTPGFNQISTITNIESNNSFYIQSSQILTNVEATTTNTSSFRVYSILQDVAVNNKKLDSFNYYVGECKFPDFSLETSSTFITEGYTATFVINGLNVDYGLGRTFAYNITNVPGSPGMSASEFAGGLSGIITNAALSLPLSFNLTTFDTVFSSPTPKLFDLNLISYITAGTPSSIPVATQRMTFLSKPSNTATYSMSLIDYQGNPVTSAVEGDIIYAVITATTATNVDFGSNGRVYQIIATGTNINNEIVFSQPTTEIIIKQPTDLPITFNIQLREDFTTEGLEKLYLNLMTYQNVIQGTNTNYVATASINIIDTSITGQATYQLFSSATSIYEGSSTTIFLKTINIPVGTQIAWTLTQQIGNLNINDITVNGVFTTSFTGTFVMVDGAPFYSGFQIGEIKIGALPDVAGEGFEPLETWRLSLIGNTSTFIDIDVRDSIVPFFGNKKLWSYAYSGNKAFTRVRILNSGTFALENSPYGMSPSTKPNDANEKYSLNSAALSGLYVRATVEPTDSLWQGNVRVTGPGFATAITSSDVILNGFTPIQGSWVTISTAESYTSGGEYGWYASGSYTTSTGLAANAGFNLIIELSTTSGGPVIVSGSYRCRISSVEGLI